jgi:hypothetical protein
VKPSLFGFARGPAAGESISLKFDANFAKTRLEIDENARATRNRFFERTC